MSSNLDTPRRATHREWIGLAVLALPCILYAMDLTVLNLAVPHLTADLKPSAEQLLWIIDIYGFLVAGTLLTMGTLGDRIGRRKLLLIGAAAFGAASVLAAYSTSAEMLIAARALLGVAAATLAPSTLSLLRVMFEDPKQRSIAIGVWIASFSAGGAIGPLIGGVLLTHFWWGSVFLAAVPVMVLLLILGPSLLPEYRDPEAGDLDIFSVALSIAAVLAVIYGIKRIAADGADAQAFGAIAAGAVIGILFVLRQRRMKDPLLDMSLFCNPAFSGALLINVVGFFAMFSAFLFIAQYLQLVLGLSALEAGLWTAPSGIAFILGSILTAPLSQKLPPAITVASGFVVAALGFVLVAWTGSPMPMATLVGGFIVFSLGLAPVVTLMTDLIVGAAPPERAGAAAGMAETSTEFGGAAGIAVLGSLVTALYRDGIVGTLPSDLSAEQVRSAEDTLGAAIAVASDLSGPSAGTVLDTARHAFSGAFQITTLLSAFIVTLAAILAVTLLRRVRPAAG